jgi:hypothetical protein
MTESASDWFGAIRTLVATTPLSGAFRASSMLTYSRPYSRARPMWI